MNKKEARKELRQSFERPVRRLRGIAKQLKEIASDIEARKFDPGKIKRLTERLEEVTDSVWDTFLSYLLNPVHLMAISFAILSPQRKEEPPPEPRSEAERGIIIKWDKGSAALMEVLLKVKSGELPESDFDSLIARAEELAA